MLIEVTTFRLAEGTDEDALLAADRAVQAELSSREGFLRRTTARDGRSWLVITLWQATADADHSRQTPMEDPAAWAFGEMAAAAGQETKRYVSLG